MDKQDNVTNSTSADEEVVEVNEYSHDTVYYSIHLIHSSGPAMDPPALNVSETGVVPEEDGGGKFAVSLPCTGKATAEVDFLLEVNAEDKEGRSRFSGQSAKTRKPIDLYSQIKFTFDGPTERSETLNFKRRKVCLASASSILEKAASVPKQDYEDEKNKNGRGTEHDDDDDEHETGGEDDNDDDKGPSRLDPSSTTIVALGAAAGTIALLFILLTVTDPERQAKRQNILDITILQFMYVTRRKRLPRTAYTSSLSFAPPGSTMHLRRHEGFQLPSHQPLPPSGPGGPGVGGGGQPVYRSDMAVNGGVGAPVGEIESFFCVTGI